MNMKVGVTYHMGMHKRLILALIREEGKFWRQIVKPKWKGTPEELIEKFKKDPREIFVGCDCEKEADGSCAGIRTKGKR